MLYPTENHLNITPKTNMKIIPSQNDGTDIKTPIIKSPIFFTCLFFILYSKKDRGTDTKNTIPIEIRAISNVRGSLLRIRSTTGSENT